MVNSTSVMERSPLPRINNIPLRQIIEQRKQTKGPHKQTTEKEKKQTTETANKQENKQENEKKKQKLSHHSES